jgi:hypothetical protein
MCFTIPHLHVFEDWHLSASCPLPAGAFLALSRSAFLDACSADSGWAAAAKVVLPGNAATLPDDAKMLRRPVRAAIYGRTRPRLA